MTSFDDEAWAVGHGGGIAHLSGGQWTEQVRTVGFPLLDVHGSAVDNVWAVGPEPLGLLIHYDGRTWSRDVPTANLIEPYLDRVWVVSSTDAWAFGAHRPLGSASFVNLVLRYDGRHWNQVATPNRNRVNAACATGGQVFTVGDLGETARFDGTRWSILSSTTTRNLLSVHCSSPTDVWASVYLPVGPALVHWDGNAWSFDHGGPTEFVSSFVGSATDLFAFGARQWHYDGRQWTAGPNLPQRMSIVGTASQRPLGAIPRQPLALRRDELERLGVRGRILGLQRALGAWLGCVRRGQVHRASSVGRFPYAVRSHVSLHGIRWAAQASAPMNIRGPGMSSLGSSLRPIAITRPRSACGMRRAIARAPW